MVVQHDLGCNLFSNLSVVLTDMDKGDVCKNLTQSEDSSFRHLSSLTKPNIVWAEDVLLVQMRLGI